MEDVTRINIRLTLIVENILRNEIYDKETKLRIDKLRDEYLEFLRDLVGTELMGMSKVWRCL